jgi:UPF0716 protein FxsA
VASPLIPLAIIATPLVEIAVFVLVGSQIGVLATVGLVIATSVLGAILLRIQGFGIMTRLRSTMGRGEPGRDLVHGFMVMVAGFLLFLPGFVTDVIGLILFIPAVRDVAWRFISKRIVVVKSADPRFYRGPRDPRTVDLDADEFTRQDDEPNHQALDDRR